MDKRHARVLLTGLLAGVWLSGPVVAQAPQDQTQVEEIVAFERERYRALAEADMDAVERYHADDFVLVNPFGHVEPRQLFLERIGSGILVFVSAENSDVEVRVYGDVAMLKQRTVLAVELEGQPLPPVELWEVFTYERRNGEWQAVWSIATEVREMPGG